MESEIQQYYQTNNPGQVQVLGPDLFNGSAAELTSFKITGVTFPLLLLGGNGVGNENLYIPYGDRDSYSVIDKQGIVRYMAYPMWPYGNRYHLSELRGAIDGLVVGVDDGLATPGYRLAALPNVFQGETTIQFSNPTGSELEARVTVHDLSGRRIASLWSGATAPGVRRVAWDARAENGTPVPPGVYLVRSDVGGVRLSCRVVVVR